MKKILLSLAVIAIVSAVTVGATRAYFSDTETSSGNTFSAGTLDLTVDGQDGAGVVTRYTLTNWEPGMNQNVGQIKIKNVGSVNGKYWIEIKNVVNNENGCNSPETNSGDTTCNADEGELGSKITGYFQENIAPWAHLTPGITTSLDASEGVAMATVVGGGAIAAGEEKPIVFYAKWLSSSTDNLAQGDSVSFDLVFHLEQD